MREARHPVEGNDMTFARTKPWERPPSLVPKSTGRSLEDKGPARCADWLARIRGLPCLCCAHGRQQHPTRAHHPKGLFPRTMGKRVSDLLCMPLCDWHHTLGPQALHQTGDEAAWWRSMGVEPYGVLLSILSGCREPERDEAIAFVKLNREQVGL
ncbi:MAG: hypothetical protein Q8R02_23345 [Hyphomonadaceae bacterium]|nr:hypothetical protein [Hyphomonadaceae bacterium]